MLSAARTEVIGERRARADENVVFEDQTIPKIDSGFEGHTVADPNSTLHKGMVADVAVFTDDSTFDEMREGPDAGARPNGHTFVHQRMGVDERFHRGKTKLGNRGERTEDRDQGSVARLEHKP